MGYIPLPENVVAARAEGVARASSERRRARSGHHGPHRRLGARPPSWDYFADRAFRRLAQGGVWLILLLLAFILWSIGCKASVGDAGATDSASSRPRPGTSARQQFGVLPQIWGTLYSSLLALLVGGFFGIVDGDLPDRRTSCRHGSRRSSAPIVELLAAIPSVVYGLWGLFVVVPAMRPAANWLFEQLGWIPFFGTTLSGPGLAPAALVLAIMVLPTVAAVSQDALRLVPYRVKEAAYGMGATRWEAILQGDAPAAATGIFGALVLGFGRALGETMALAMLIGNSNQISLSLFSPANTLAALLALNFPEAGPREVAGLDVRGAGRCSPSRSSST